MFITPTVVGERLLVGSCAGTFLGVEVATGSVVWRHETTEDGALGEFHGDPLVTGDVAVVGAHGRRLGFLYGFEPVSGRLRWKIRIPQGIAVRVLRHGDTALAVTLGGEVLAVDLDSGTERWRLEPPEDRGTYYDGDPVLENGRLFVPREGGWIDAVEAATGELVWRRSVDAELSTSAVLFEGELVVGTSDGRLLRLDVESGELLGTYDPGEPGGVMMGHLVGTGRCVLALQAGRWSDEALAFEGPFSIGCLRPSSGEVLWEDRSKAPWTSLHPLVRGGEVVVGSAGRLRGLDLASGAGRWERTVDGTPRGLGAQAETLYVGTREGVLLALPWRPTPTSGSGNP